MTNRPIEFRAWFVEEKKMVYEQGLVLDLIGEWGDGEDHHIMQFTGLLDKNGTKIFEGDIVEQQGRDLRPTRGLVTFGEFFETQFNTHCWLFGHMPIDVSGDNIWFVVVGNIYENPELLK